MEIYIPINKKAAKKGRINPIKTILPATFPLKQQLFVKTDIIFLDNNCNIKRETKQKVQKKAKNINLVKIKIF